MTESWKETDGGGWWECHGHGKEWFRLLRLSAQCCFSGCLEWWCYEILILLAGRLPEAQQAVAVLTIILNFDYLLYHIMISIATCASTRVANELGAGEPQASRSAACVSLLLSAVTGLASGALMLALKGIFARFFSRNEEILAGVRRMVPFMAIAEVFNFPLGACGGILRGTTRPWLGMGGVVGFYLAGLPLAIGLAFRVGYGLFGLFSGFVVGSAVSVGFMGVLVGKIDWFGEAMAARESAVEEVGNDDEASRGMMMKPV